MKTMTGKEALYDLLHHDENIEDYERERLNIIKQDLEILDIFLNNAWIEKGKLKYKGIEVIYSAIGSISDNENFIKVMERLKDAKRC